MSQEEVTVPPQDLRTVIQKLRLSHKDNSNLLVALTAREFKELLHICTVLVEGEGSVYIQYRHRANAHTFSACSKRQQIYKIWLIGYETKFQILPYLLGLENMKQGNYSAALVAFLEAVALPAPRVLLAQVHTLTGFAFAKLVRKALEPSIS